MFQSMNKIIHWLKEPVSRPELKRQNWHPYLLEWLFIVIIIWALGQAVWLDLNPYQLQQTGEHNESTTLPILAEIGLKRYGEIPLWNPYMLTGFPHAGDLVNHFWNPVATLPVLIWGGINGFKVSVFLSLLVAGLGQWVLAHLFGLRGVVRLWTGAMYALSGGLLLLWRLGWYELLVGAAWFPWAFGAVWWSMSRPDRRSLILATVPIVMVLTTGGGYYPFYLGVSLLVLVLVAVWWGRPADWRVGIRRAATIALLSLGLLAVMLLPLIDGLRLTARDFLTDTSQSMSQPIPYALLNYVVGDKSWFGIDVLGKGIGFGWFYIGYLPLAALLFTPLAYSNHRRIRPELSAMLILFIILLLWHANRYTPIKYIYNWIPWLYTLRFPNRLLIIATSPLLIVAGISLQSLWLILRRRGQGLWFGLVANRQQRGLTLKRISDLALTLLLFLALRDVYRINKDFALQVDSASGTAWVMLKWLKGYDPGFYYSSVGAETIWWSWTPAGYDLEMPLLNFRYNRRLRSMDAQMNSKTSPFIAKAKYVFISVDHPPLSNAEIIYTANGINVWQQLDALPTAFAATPAGLQLPQLTTEQVHPLTARLDGPNRVIVQGAPAGANEQLVLLVSDYPGWQLTIDGRPAGLAPVNGYLGAVMEPGEHLYTFVFRPVSHTIGLIISLLTLALCLGLWFRTPPS